MSGRRGLGWLVVLGAAAVAAGLYLLLRPMLAAPPLPVTVGSAAPEFRAATLSGSPPTLALRDFAGHPLLLNLWATWCQPCREEMPSFERLYRDDGPRGLRIVAVSVDDPGTDDAIRALVRQNGLTFDVLHGARSRIMAQYQVRGVPETFLISAQGRIVGTQYGRDWSTPESRALVDSLLLAPAR